MGQLTQALNELEDTYKKRDIAQALLHSNKSLDWEHIDQYTEFIDECNIYIEVLWHQIEQITKKKGTEVPLD